jgi:hypothetical protein
VSVAHGIYGRTDLVSTLVARQGGERLLQIAASIAVIGPGAVASHHDAAAIHGLALLDQPSADVVMVSKPAARSVRDTNRTWIRVHQVPLPRDQVTVRDGIPVTSAARTVVDLARTESFRAGVVVTDSALHRWLTSKAELGAVAGSCGGWPGIGQARRVVDFAERRSESPFESIARVAFDAGGLPPPTLQAWIADEEGPFARADFLWEKYRTIAEPDGALKYENPDRARRQLARDARLRRAGYEVVHFTWRDLMTAPDQVVSWIKAAFGRAALQDAGRRRGGRVG